MLDWRAAMTEMHVAIATMTGFVLLMSLFTLWVRRHVLAEPVLGLLLGIAIGPAGLGWLAFEGDDRVVLEQAARFTLAIMLVSVGTSLPRHYLRQGWRSLTVLTLGGMALAWLASTVLLIWILGIGLLPALLIGAVLTPLDPVLAAGVAVGKVPEEDVPDYVRHLLGFESAASHGLGYMLVLLPAFLITHAPGEAWAEWAVESLLWDGVVAVAVGALVGSLIGRVHRWSLKRHLAAMGSLTTTFLALGLGVAAAVHLMGSSGLLAVFVAGILYARTRTQEKSDELEAERIHYETTFKQILQVPVFALFGVVLPWTRWGELGWSAAALVAAILLFRRLPAILLLRPFVPKLQRWDVAVYVGWFGSVGVGALHFALLAESHTQLEQVWVVGSLIIATSIVAHDATLRPLTKWLRQRLVAA